jgi:hypothetical protein
MTSQTPSKSSELGLTLGSAHVDLLRAFVREAALAEGVSLGCSGLIADDSAAAWQALSTNATGHERARVTVSCSHRAVNVRVLLHGHARFADVVGSLGQRLRPGTGISCHESGIDNWEVSLNRSLTDVDAAHLAPPAVEVASVSPASTDEFRIGLAEKRDTAAIARCFLEVDGHHYVHGDVFSPRRYWAKVESGELIPAVTRNSEGEVIGHVSLERDAGAHVAERGEAVVLPAYRGHRLLERMTELLTVEAPKHGLLGIYAEPLTIHTFSQRNDARANMPVCAALLGANPENFRPKDIPCPTAGQRQSYLRTFSFVQPPAPRSLQFTGPYQSLLLKIYQRLGVQVATAGPAGPAIAESVTRIRVNERGYGVIRFAQAGANCAVELSQALRDVHSLGARSVQLSAAVSDPGLTQLVEAARGLGFFFCGLGPSFADGDDLLLMQHLSEPLDTGKLQLFTDEAKELVAFIEADRLAVQAGAR